MTTENEQRLLRYISELEARVVTMERFINAVVELNNLKVPTSYQLSSELSKQNKIAHAKYVHLSYWLFNIIKCCKKNEYTTNKSRIFVVLTKNLQTSGIYWPSKSQYRPYNCRFFYFTAFSLPDIALGYIPALGRSIRFTRIGLRY